MSEQSLHAYDPVLDGFRVQEIEAFLKAGVYPPPYAGDSGDPWIVIMCLASQERFMDAPDLLGTDEEGVLHQMSVFEAKAISIRESMRA